jgi:hypothetical protein
MELNQFITKALVEIATGITNANTELNNRSFEIEAFRRDKETGFVSFDIAVKTNEENGKGAKAVIQVINLGIGGEVKKSSNNEQANRIKFYVLPCKNIG